MAYARRFSAPEVCNMTSISPGGSYQRRGSNNLMGRTPSRSILKQSASNVLGMLSPSSSRTSIASKESMSGASSASEESTSSSLQLWKRKNQVNDPNTVESLQRNVASLTMISKRDRREIKALKKEIELLGGKLKNINIRGDKDRESTATPVAMVPLLQAQNNPPDTPSFVKNDNAQHELDEQKRKFNELEQRCRNISQNNQRLVEQVKKNQKKEAELQQELKKHQELYNKSQTAQQKFQQDLDLNNEAMKMKEELEKQLKEKQQQIQEAEEATKTREYELVSTRRSLEKKLQVTQAELTKQLGILAHERNFSRREKNESNRELAALEGQVQSLQNNLQAAESENAKGKQQRASLENNQKILLDKLERVAAECEDERSRNKSLQDQVSSMIALEEAQKNSQLEAEKAQSEIHELIKEIGSLEATIEALKTKNSSLELEKSIAAKTLDPTVQALERARAGQDEALAILHKETKQLQNSLRSMEAENARLRAEGQQLSQTINELDREVGLKDKLQHEMASKQSAIKDLEQNALNLSNANSCLQNQMEQLKLKYQHTIQERDEALELQKKATSAQREIQQRLQQLEGNQLGIADQALLRSTQAELLLAVTKIQEAESASETTMTCMQCMDLFRNPVTLVKCGHSYCKGCLRDPSLCPECGEVNPSGMLFPNHALSDLSARFNHRQQSLAALVTMCKKLKSGFPSK